MLIRGRAERRKGARGDPDGSCARNPSFSRIFAVCLMLAATVLSAEFDVRAQTMTPAQKQAQLAVVRGKISEYTNELNIIRGAQQQPGITNEQLQNLLARAAQLQAWIAELRQQEQALAR